MKSTPLPDPVLLGFPPKFTSWYDDQLIAVDKVLLNPKRFSALAMPTGSGKSPTGMLVSLLHPEVKRVVYLTSTKGLQDQLAPDFQSLGLIDLRGARNYPCHAVEPGGHLDRYRRSRHDIGCDEGPCHSGVRCDFAPARERPAIRPDCAYYGAVWDARRAALVSTNYAMYFATEEYAEGLGPIDLLILDEAHDADKELEAFLAVEVTGEDAKYIGSKLLKDTNLQAWKDWADHHRTPLDRKLEARALHPPIDIEGVKDTKRLKRIKGILDRLSNIDPLDWILDLDPMRARFAPMRVSKYAESHLFRGIPHILLMSATMTPKTLQLLGIGPDKVLFWECPSRFPLSQRPVISVNTYPSVRVDARMHETTKYLWLQRIDRILGPRLALNWNGIIHTVSYQRMKELMAMSEYRDRFIVHDPSNTREQIQWFKAHPGEGWVLVSPSVVTGYDFPDDQCRFQIIGKVPQPDMRGPILKVRAELDKEYAGYLAMQKLVQACGRGMRGPDDWCECVSPETRILTKDLRWVAAADIAEGTELLAFDEEGQHFSQSRVPGVGASVRRRKWQWSTVVKSRVSTMPRVRVILNDAELICTPNHPWLIHAHRKEQGYSRMQAWWRADRLQPGDKMLRLLEPWTTEDTYEKGWLSGFTDGEGCLAIGRGKRNRGVLQVFLSQNVTDTALRAADYLTHLGYRFGTTFPRPEHAVLSIRGGATEQLRFLGEIRPNRLLDKFLASERLEDLRRTSVSTVLRVERLPDGPISSFQTSTATYVAEGFGAHNTFIVDDHFADWFLRRFSKHAPRWFKDAILYVEHIPAPLEFVA